MSSSESSGSEVLITLTYSVRDDAEGERRRTRSIFRHLLDKGLKDAHAKSPEYKVQELPKSDLIEKFEEALEADTDLEVFKKFFEGVSSTPEYVLDEWKNIESDDFPSEDDKISCFRGFAKTYTTHRFLLHTYAALAISYRRVDLVEAIFNTIRGDNAFIKEHLLGFKGDRHDESEPYINEAWLIEPSLIDSLRTLESVFNLYFSPINCTGGVVDIDVYEFCKNGMAKADRLEVSHTHDKYVVARIDAVRSGAYPRFYQTFLGTLPLLGVGLLVTPALPALIDRELLPSPAEQFAAITALLPEGKQTRLTDDEPSNVPEIDLSYWDEDEGYHELALSLVQFAAFLGHQVCFEDPKIQAAIGSITPDEWSMIVASYHPAHETLPVRPSDLNPRSAFDSEKNVANPEVYQAIRGSLTALLDVPTMKAAKKKAFKSVAKTTVLLTLLGVIPGIIYGIYMLTLGRKTKWQTLKAEYAGLEESPECRAFANGKLKQSKKAVSEQPGLVDLGSAEAILLSLPSESGDSSEQSGPNAAKQLKGPRPHA